MIKKTFALLSVLALVICGCEKEEDQLPSSKYEKTEIRFTSVFSEDYLKLFDVTLEGTDFDGNAVSFKPTGGKQSFSIETSKKDAQSTLRLHATRKQIEIAETDTFEIKTSLEAFMGASNQGSNGWFAMKNCNFTGASSERTIPGKRILEKPEMLDNPIMTFDRTFRFSVIPNEKSVSIDIERLGN